MTDEPKNQPPEEPSGPASTGERAASDNAESRARADSKAPGPGAEAPDAGSLPPPPDSAETRPTPESQAALTGKAPSGSSVAGTTVPASSEPKAEAAPPAAETPEQKKARLIAEHKAKLAAKAAAASEGAETKPEEQKEAAAEPQPPGGASPSVGDPSKSPSQADLEKAAKIAEAKARAAAAKEAAAAKAAGGAAAPAGAAGAAAAPGAPKAPVKKKDEGPKPADASDHPLVKRLRERHDGAVLGAATFLGQLSVTVAPESVFAVCLALRDDAETPFDYLSDLTCVHRPENADAPFEVVYNLYSISKNERVRLKASAGADGIESVTGVWPAANWMEREVFDLFGVAFKNHPDLRRLLLPTDWEGHPLRKDYPLEFIENNWTTKHLPEFTDVQREQLEQRRAYGLEVLSVPDERRIREIFRAGREVMPLDRK